jgi:hypothetical protein
MNASNEKKKEESDVLWMTELVKLKLCTYVHALNHDYVLFSADSTEIRRRFFVWMCVLRPISWYSPSKLRLFCGYYTEMSTKKTIKIIRYSNIYLNFPGKIFKISGNFSINSNNETPHFLIMIRALFEICAKYSSINVLKKLMIILLFKINQKLTMKILKICVQHRLKRY